MSAFCVGGFLMYGAFCARTKNYLLIRRKANLHNLCMKSNPVVQIDEVLNTNCGQRNPNGATFTIKDLPGFAQEAETPWMVALLRRDLSYKAGGALIADNVVITAAHVLENLHEYDLIVRAGEWDFQTDSETYGHVDVGIRKIVRHPDVDTFSGANNLAILFLNDRIKLAKNIQPICLPKEEQYPGRQCIFTGWGQKDFGRYSNMNLMKKVEMPVVSNDVCQRTMRDFYGDEFELHNSLMCAGGEEGKDSCQGDGGSPLACPLSSDPTRYELAGVVNFGVGCGERGYPGAYTSIAKLKSWIIQERAKYNDPNVIHRPPVGPANRGARDVQPFQNGNFAYIEPRTETSPVWPIPPQLPPNQNQNSRELWHKAFINSGPNVNNGNVEPPRYDSQPKPNTQNTNNFNDPHNRFNPSQGQQDNQYGVGGRPNINFHMVPSRPSTSHVSLWPSQNFQTTPIPQRQYPMPPFIPPNSVQVQPSWPTPTFGQQVNQNGFGRQQENHGWNLGPQNSPPNGGNWPQSFRQTQRFPPNAGENQPSLFPNQPVPFPGRLDQFNQITTPRSNVLEGGNGAQSFGQTQRFPPNGFQNQPSYFPNQHVPFPSGRLDQFNQITTPRPTVPEEVTTENQEVFSTTLGFDED
ncbi:uncharacterized protein LOC122320264 isoform X2 [Drosophila ficusphila]|uniref:uncharacterized protein LOC122320264 isoform X2 n=1 Tax=Drosophila ficusphila TaxID=30025 RepID=UPI001C89276F|nr:uncharacterized protein LOC122320264 isoform X2 [Drosophila ficusphila]